MTHTNDYEEQACTADLRAEVVWLRGVVRAVIASLREHGYAGAATSIEIELKRGQPATADERGYGLEGMTADEGRAIARSIARDAEKIES